MTTYHEFELKKFSHRPRESCVPALELPTLSQEIKETNAFNLGEALQSYYPLLELIFKYLDKQALKSVKLVNVIWKELAEKELNKRIWPSWVSFSNPHNWWLTCSEGFNYNNVAIGIFVYDPTLINLGKNLCVHGSLNKKKVNVTDYMDVITLETQLKYCTIACASVTSILPLKYNDNVAFQGLFIPVIPHIRTVMFEAHPKSPDLITNYINPREQVKCCIIFSKRSRGIDAVLLALINGQNPKDVAMGGGIINSKKSLRMPECKNFNEQAIFCITFLQNNDSEATFNAYSAVIINKDEDQHGFTDELLKFKETTVLHKYGVIFRFCCKAKIWKHEETNIIQTYFPDFIVYGIDVEGEIGWNTFDVPDYDAPKKKKRKDALPNYFYGWSTVLVLITWNK